MPVRRARRCRCRCRRCRCPARAHPPRRRLDFAFGSIVLIFDGSSLSLPRCGRHGAFSRNISALPWCDSLGTLRSGSPALPRCRSVLAVPCFLIVAECAIDALPPVDFLDPLLDTVAEASSIGEGELVELSVPVTPRASGASTGELRPFRIVEVVLLSCQLRTCNR